MLNSTLSEKTLNEVFTSCFFLKIKITEYFLKDSLYKSLIFKLLFPIQKFFYSQNKTYINLKLN